MDKIAPLNEQANISRVVAGLSGGPFCTKMITPTPMSIVDGWPKEVTEKLNFPTIKQPMPIDSWNQRR